MNHLAWYALLQRAVEPWDHYKLITQRIAWLSRYTSATLTELLHVDLVWLSVFAEEVDKIIRKECGKD